MAKSKFEPKYANGLKTPKGRFIYPHLDKVDSSGQYADGKYKTTLLIPKDADLRALKGACVKLAKEAWGDDVEIKKVKFPFRDGDQKTNEEGEIYDGYEDHWFITCKTKKKMVIVDRARDPMDADLIKGGDYGRLGVSAMCYESSKDVEDAEGNISTRKVRGVTLLLDSVQFLEEGPSLGGGGGASAAVFDDGEFDEEPAVGSSSSGDDDLDDIMG